MRRYMRAMRNADNTGLPFMKMHGLGNDFVVLDGRACTIEMTRLVLDFDFVEGHLEFGPGLGRFEDMIAKEQQLLVGRSPLRIGRGRFGKHLCRLILRQLE